ncbi:MAG: hypothetical protein DMG54_05145 [Acidobacteria bacterium]|nr:MAG: hypothetical protein DMG54_05145 [Acidobacteriota bacterium]PYU67399.1 MAG: hypothetical protein DMG52_34240 [Acidobacteriota bacterium]
MSNKVERKVKPAPAHVGHANPHPAKQEGDGVHNGVPTEKNRAQQAVKPSAPGRVQQALEAGPHGSIHNADGTTQATPNKHGKTRGY